MSFGATLPAIDANTRAEVIARARSLPYDQRELLVDMAAATDEGQAKLWTWAGVGGALGVAAAGFVAYKLFARKGRK